MPAGIRPNRRRRSRSRSCSSARLSSSLGGRRDGAHGNRMQPGIYPAPRGSEPPPHHCPRHALHVGIERRGERLRRPCRRRAARARPQGRGRRADPEPAGRPRVAEGDRAGARRHALTLRAGLEGRAGRRRSRRLRRPDRRHRPGHPHAARSEASRRSLPARRIGHARDAAQLTALRHRSCARSVRPERLLGGAAPLPCPQRRQLPRADRAHPLDPGRAAARRGLPRPPRRPHRLRRGDAAS